MSDIKVRCAFDAMVDIDELLPHPKNRNKHPEQQIKRLAAILEYQGFRYPIKVSNLSGFITSGHGRLEAAKLNGWTQVPVNYQDYEDEAQEYADVIADNAVADWADLDLAGINFDVPDFGPEFDLDMLGLENFTLEPAEKIDLGETFESDSSADGPRKYILEITFPNDMEMMDIHDDLISRGYIVKVK